MAFEALEGLPPLDPLQALSLSNSPIPPNGIVPRARIVSRAFCRASVPWRLRMTAERSSFPRSRTWRLSAALTCSTRTHGCGTAPSPRACRPSSLIRNLSPSIPISFRLAKASTRLRAVMREVSIRPTICISPVATRRRAKDAFVGVVDHHRVGRCGDLATPPRQTPTPAGYTLRALGYALRGQLTEPRRDATFAQPDDLAQPGQYPANVPRKRGRDRDGRDISLRRCPGCPAAPSPLCSFRVCPFCPVAVKPHSTGVAATVTTETSCRLQRGR
jgi:hypothetical protein